MPTLTRVTIGASPEDRGRTLGEIASIRLATSLLAAVATLSACSRGESDDYCDKLADATGELRGANPRTLDQDALDSLRATADELHEAAPGMVVDDWRRVVASYAALDSTLRDAGLTADDLVDIQAGTGDTSSADAEVLERFGEIRPELDEIMADDELEMSADAIAEHALTECGVDMSE